MIAFEFNRFRFHFRAAQDLHFPRGTSANALRGAFGAALRESAPREVYAHIFEPRHAARPGDASVPSGLAEWPRPFLFRPAHLDGITAPEGGAFFFDAHIFDLRSRLLPHFERAFVRLGEKGIGPGRQRARLERVERLGLDDSPAERACVLPLDPDPAPASRVVLRFITPTELKSGGRLAERPEFAILFGRLRDRLSTLRALYGPGPLAIDFRGLGERAAAVRLCRAALTWERAERRSARTGRVHPLGGFTGEAEYEGPLGEFLPWLRAAHWVGVGRQTVWGKGDVRVMAYSGAARVFMPRDIFFPFLQSWIHPARFLGRADPTV